MTEFQVCVFSPFLAYENLVEITLLPTLFRQIVPICQMNSSARIAIWIVCTVDVVELVFQNHLDVTENSTAPMA